MWVLFFIQLSVVLIFLVIGWAILKKEAYGLISSFRSRPKSEQEELIKKGYPQKTGKMLLVTGIVLLALLPLLLTSFPYALEMHIGVMVIMLLGGFIYVSKYDLPSKRKRSYIISILIAVITVGTLAVVFFLGIQEPKMTFNEDTFVISGVYGGEWKYSELTHIEIVDEMPEVTLRTNGYGTPSISKGHFRVKDVGKSLLFIYKGNSPYIFIETERDKIFINSKSAGQTKDWYDLLKEQVRQSE
ncbi:MULTISPECIES: DUF3784 domain-containing protein [unclassified Sutcliffiella]|uniref:DUF3784 domain-containing protein n=1 Tax=unclassified Sutcliffiella TaxID=2837532 RepID=UPI0030D4298D